MASGRSFMILWSWKGCSRGNVYQSYIRNKSHRCCYHRWQWYHSWPGCSVRPYLIEIMHSDKIQISNLTFVNSPSWNVHPVYSSGYHIAPSAFDCYAVISRALGSEMSGGIEDVREHRISQQLMLRMAKKGKKYRWSCVDVKGISSGVVPRPCNLLVEQGEGIIGMCDFPADSLAIDAVELQKCSHMG
ncbi:putative polygalacturonase [Dorcoceras hygrometricum]|uniref:Putative polygalacturonase n=1 Tax=Dorcoceras hygrometricum TaxID=472368 RepID=A0A2Z7BS27_9LAMI|nr:putative polygalacturonase [Dorcoceras hygrometricum]